MQALTTIAKDAIRFRPRLSPRVERVLSSAPFRLAFAALIVAYHVVTVARFARERFDAPFNNAPDAPPVLTDPAHDIEAQNERRLIVSRWDSGHYISLAIRGYSACPDRKLTREELKSLNPQCNLSFFPGYPIIGRAVHAVTKAPYDYALFSVSLVAAFTTMFLFTDRSITKKLGVGVAYLALVLFNAWPASCYLVFIMTEPSTVAFALAGFVALLRRHFLVGAILTGAASAMRVSGACASVAFAVAVVAWTYAERPRGALRWAARVMAIPLAGWGILAIMAYHGVRFGDPLAYFHSQELTHWHNYGARAFLYINTEWLLRSIDGSTHDGVWLGLVGIWIAIGHRAALRGFSFAEQLYAYVLVVLTIFVALSGSLEFWLAGVTRYSLVAFPLFFIMAAAMRRWKVVLVLWLAVSTWHYREIDACLFLGYPGQNAVRKCNKAQWQHL